MVLDWVAAFYHAVALNPRSTDAHGHGAAALLQGQTSTHPFPQNSSIDAHP
jgi:hypothetical protein